MKGYLYVSVISKLKVCISAGIFRIVALENMCDFFGISIYRRLVIRRPRDIFETSDLSSVLAAVDEVPPIELSLDTVSLSFRTYLYNKAG